MSAAYLLLSVVAFLLFVACPLCYYLGKEHGKPPF